MKDFNPIFARKNKTGTLQAIEMSVEKTLTDVKKKRKKKKADFPTRENTWKNSQSFCQVALFVRNVKMHCKSKQAK